MTTHVGTGGVSSPQATGFGFSVMERCMLGAGALLALAGIALMVFHDPIAMLLIDTAGVKGDPRLRAEDIETAMYAVIIGGIIVVLGGGALCLKAIKGDSTE